MPVFFLHLLAFWEKYIHYTIFQMLKHILMKKVMSMIYMKTFQKYAYYQKYVRFYLTVEGAIENSGPANIFTFAGVE